MGVGYLVGDRLHLVVLGHFRPISSQGPIAHHLAVLPEDLSQQGTVGPAHISQGAHAVGKKRLLGGGAHAGERAHGELLQKRRLGAGKDHGEPSGLVAVRGDFRHRFGGAHADGAGDAEGGHALLDALGHENRVLGVHGGGGDVHEGLVDGDLLHVGRLVPQDGHDGGGNLAVAVEVPVGPDGIRAQLSRQRRGHGAAHPEGAGLVGAGGDDSVGVRVAADDDGLAPPGRVIQLLDGGEEGVQVHQQDGRPLPRWQTSAVIAHWPGRTGPWCRGPNGHR